jgi:hypothetical protein
VPAELEKVGTSRSEITLVSVRSVVLVPEPGWFTACGTMKENESWRARTRSMEGMSQIRFEEEHESEKPRPARWNARHAVATAFATSLLWRSEWRLPMPSGFHRDREEVRDPA